MLIAVISNRNKTGKTTVVSCLGHALANRKPPNKTYVPLAYDGDFSAQLRKWYKAAKADEDFSEFPFDVRLAATTQFEDILEEHPHEGKVGLVDTAHLEDSRGYAEAVMEHADAVILMTEPNLNELERLEALPLADAMAKVDANRAAAGRQPIRRLVMFFRVPTSVNAQDVKTTREYITDAANAEEWGGWQVLTTKMTENRKLARLSETNPPSLDAMKSSGMDQLVTELENLGVLV
ncbi:hypothetical protein ACIBEA_42170 [Streptomyces sp. NPDC051555]|uniref:hypothetical protein n=1 Tax=Streptomyces sp. NPDC051555 TaxID=3365657 RepID=UPI00378C6C37